MNNIKQLTLATIMYSDDQNHTFPNDGQDQPYYPGADFREGMTGAYKIARASFYCPSNPGRNKPDDTFWDFSSGRDPANPTVAGYFYFAGYPRYNDPTLIGTYYPANGALPGGDNLRGHLSIFAIKYGDRPYYPLLWTDLNRKYLSVWGRENDRGVRGVNHFENGAPVGSNEGYTDGHGEWVAGSKYTKTARMQPPGGVDIFSMPTGHDGNGTRPSGSSPVWSSAFRRFPRLEFDLQTTPLLGVPPSGGPPGCVST